MGPGEISGFELGIGGVGVVEVSGVTARGNKVGLSVAKCCRLEGIRLRTIFEPGPGAGKFTKILGSFDCR